MKTNLSFTQLGSVFNIPGSAEDRRKRASDAFQTVENILMEIFVPQRLGVSHISRQQAEEHHTIYSKEFFGSLCLIWDGTYIYTGKSADHGLNRAMYSVQKKRHLVKFMSLVLPDGYVLDTIGPFYGNENDAKICEQILTTMDRLREWCNVNDVMIVDRGFRDILITFEELGFDSKMPAYLARNMKQHTAEEANDSHLIISAVLNAYRPRTTESVDPQAQKTLAMSTEQRAAMQNDLKKRVESGKLSSKSNWEKINEADFDFPLLDLDDLCSLFFRVYQLKQSRSYTAEHLDDDGNYYIEIKPYEHSLIRCAIRTRHSHSTKYYVWVEYSLRDTSEPTKCRHLKFKSGERTVGCCAHVACIIW
ncbi:unnamed protein product [Didymodactylos carnosus]|uniref:DDE Tnp4 domain-containing protein n=1 Tax=Didymodactylos carnosus TaxID=1234261 RepID=A0A815L7S8_9BILA|nr:unnamed protein product [Didymodactylos carnosus]CAF1435555.1 unnamed protein product [Didymodactylos carnosus]CAF4232906.1 unnamed protein product [Didymodactylos carnosus]CAF4297444.1 unnamed protein product [Didymodactylos carnosus]